MTADCLRCDGEGTRWAAAPGSDFETGTPCPHCHGTGQVDACDECGRACPGEYLCASCAENGA